MNEIEALTNGLSSIPFLLENFIKSIPENMLKKIRLENKWTIHEHVCHLTQAEEMIYNRFHEFKTKVEPHFSAYLPGKNIDTSKLIHLELNEQLNHFRSTREKTVILIKSFDQDMWNRKARHDEYTEYNAFIFLRHVLMHDYFHMYRIEELWLTRDEFLRKF